MFLKKFSHQSDNFVNVLILAIIRCAANSSVDLRLPAIVLDWPTGPLTLLWRFTITRPVHLNLRLYDKQSVDPVLFGKMSLFQDELAFLVFLVVLSSMNLC